MMTGGMRLIACRMHVLRVVSPSMRCVTGLLTVVGGDDDERRGM